jgi:hypothetical protein
VRSYERASQRLSASAPGKRQRDLCRFIEAIHLARELVPRFCNRFGQSAVNACGLPPKHNVMAEFESAVFSASVGT